VKIFLPYALHQPAKNPDGSIAQGPDGDGALRNGNERPIFDTLISVGNPTQSAVNVSFRFFRKDGSALKWGNGDDERVYQLQAQRSLATTLIPGNIFPDPPQDFIGYGILETRRLSPIHPGRLDLPVYAMLGGGGFYPDHWNLFSANVPVFTDEPGRADRLVPRSQWSFPYVIPFFEDLNHSKERSYRTGMVFTNFGTTSSWLHFRYVVGDMYPSVGEEYRFSLRIESRTSIVEDLYSLLSSHDYPPKMNSEGWIEITSRQGAQPASPVLPILGAPYLLHANRDYSLFSAGQSFWP
jgi:hypothetical protein